MSFNTVLMSLPKSLFIYNKCHTIEYLKISLYEIKYPHWVLFNTKLVLFKVFSRKETYFYYPVRAQYKLTVVVKL